MGVEGGNASAERDEGGMIGIMPPSLRSRRLGTLQAQAVKLLPHPHPPLAFGLLKVKPEPCIELT